MTSGGSGDGGGDEDGGKHGGSGGGSAKPPGPEWPEDPLLHPASDAGWDDEPPPSKQRTSAPPPATATSAPPTPALPGPSSAVVAGTLAPVARDDATRDARPWRSPSFPAYAPPAGSPTPARSAAAPVSPTSVAPAAPGDEPVLPASFHENDLRSAVGASPLSEPTTAPTRKRRAPASDPHDPRHGDDDDDDDDDAPGRIRNRKRIVVAAFSIAGGLAIAGLVFLGRANSDRYVLACEAERAVPQQGRAFPPWGTRGLEGEQWRPLKIAAETRCQPHETDDPLVLERLYLAMILDQATALLTAREVTKLDEAEALLKQALLLTRPAESEPAKLAGERSERHQDIERLLGDVTYWRASAKLHEAASSLADAAKQFDSAAAQRPRHVSDAEAWAAYARKLAEELHAGPTGAPQAPGPPVSAAPLTAAPNAVHPSAPPGVALPVEPAKGSAEEPPATAPPPPPDAGIPTGGVLL